MQYKVYVVTRPLECRVPECAKYFNDTHNAETYYRHLMLARKFNHRPFSLILEDINTKNVLKRYNFLPNVSLHKTQQ